jgi:methyltransferase (TIGR00027 family)
VSGSLAEDRERNGSAMGSTKAGGRPSETALFAALRRTIANLEYKNGRLGPDSFAEYFLPPHFRFFIRFDKIRANTKKKLARFMPGMHEYMIARTLFFDELFVNALNDGTPQIVLLGAGYDSRAYRFSGLNRGSHVFELDMAHTQDRKKRCLKGGRIPIPREVAFVPVNFTKESNYFYDKATYGWLHTWTMKKLKERICWMTMDR